MEPNEKKALEQLAELQLIFDASPVGLCYMDTNLRFLRVNKVMAGINGILVSEHLGRTLREVVPEIADKVEPIYRDVIETGKPALNFEVHGTTAAEPSLEKDWVTSYYPLQSEEGNVIGVTTVVMDITEKKNIEVALKKKEEKYRSLVETSQDLIWQCDDEGSFTFLNPAWEKTLGYTIEEMLGKPFTSFQTPEVAEKDMEEFSSHLEGGKVYGYETTHIAKSGETVHLVFNAIPLTDPSGNIIGTQGTAYDITSRKKMEEEILKVRKLESLGILAGGIAHDFNNILTAIMGNVGTLKIQTDTSDRAYEKLVETEKAIFRAKDLTSQLLTFARGGSPIKKTVSLGDIIRESANFVLRGSNVHCEFFIPEDLWPVDLDEGQFSQVITNLVLNADQAMPEGGTMQITCQNIPEEDVNSLTRRDDRCQGRCVKISISDNGVGIHKEHLEKIFDPYFTTKQRGGGLGLATSYSIIDKHKGMIVAESTPGEGTTFHICLSASEKEPEKKGPNEEFVKGDGKILLMDDEEIVRISVSSMLGGLGYRVDTAKDGGDAVEKYRDAKESSAPYDAVILDLTVPGGMGGKDAVAKLKEIDPEIKAIVSSGYSHDPVMAHFEDFGFAGVLSKPYRLIELSRVIHNVLKEK